MSTTTTTTSVQPAPQAPREAPAAGTIPQTGGPAEVLALSKASQERRLTDAERLRLAALDWTPDSTLEHYRILGERAPYLLALATSTVTAVLPTYLRNRQAAIDAGRRVPEPTPEYLEALDAAAAEFLASREVPAEIADVDAKRRRAQFRAAIADFDMTEALRQFALWQAEVEAVDRFVARQGAAGMAAIGRGVSTVRKLESPAFLRELEAALGSATSLPSTFGR